MTIDATPSPEIVLAHLRQRLAIRVLETADVEQQDDARAARLTMPRFVLNPVALGKTA